MLVLRPSMIDLIIHLDSPFPFSLFLFWILFGNCKIQDAGAKRIQWGPFDGHATCSPVPRIYSSNHISVDS